MRIYTYIIGKFFIKNSPLLYKSARGNEILIWFIATRKSAQIADFRHTAARIVVAIFLNIHLLSAMNDNSNGLVLRVVGVLAFLSIKYYWFINHLYKSQATR